MDSGANTSVIAEGWIILAVDQLRRINIIGFYPEKAKKTGLRIVKPITTVGIPGRKEPILLRISEAAFNSSSKLSLLSEFQLRQYGCIVDSTARQNGDRQAFFPDSEEISKISLRLKEYLLYFKS